MNKFFKVVLVTLSVPIILGLVIGVLYSKGLIGEKGWWVDALSLANDLLLDKVGFAFEAAAALYLVVWAFFSKLAKVYSFGKWLLIKCLIGITTVPVFVIVAGFWIPGLHPLFPMAIFLTLEGLVLGWAWYFLLP